MLLYLAKHCEFYRVWSQPPVAQRGVQDMAYSILSANLPHGAFHPPALTTTTTTTNKYIHSIHTIQHPNSPCIRLYTFFYLYWEKQLLSYKFYKSVTSSYMYVLLYLLYTFSSCTKEKITADQYWSFVLQRET